MSVLYPVDTDVEGVEPDDARHHAPAAAVWSALDADRRALDERTARLRVMRLALGDDELA